MTESASTRKMYNGELEPEEMPRSLQESYNASQADNPPQIEDPEEGLYDEAAYSPELLQREDALDAFGELFGN
ncbi:MAG: hypothetical protein ABEJ36_05710 [Candidatus Nanosalina sp.]